MSAFYGNPHYLFAIVPGGVVCLDDRVEVKLAFDEPVGPALLALLARGFDSPSLAAAAGIGIDDANYAVDALARRGMLVREPPASHTLPGAALTDALLADEPPRTTWTQSELLSLPSSLPNGVAHEALIAFVAGLAPPGRTGAYQHVLRTRERSTWGDVPEQEPLADALELAQRQPDEIVVVRLAERSLTSVAVNDLGRLGAASVHRLGTVVSLDAVPPGEPLTGVRHVFRARWASRPDRDGMAERAAYGIADEEARARLAAHAEAVERYAAGEVAWDRLVLAAEAELPEALGPERFYLRNHRQRAEPAVVADWAPGETRLWARAVLAEWAPCEARRSAPAAERSDMRRWVPAELVYCPFVDPRHRRPAALPSSSGLAAHRDPKAAVEAAVCELIERDAFIWTWLQRVSRERIDARTLPAEAQALAARIRDLGYAVDLVNLTLDTKPVILAALHREDRFLVATACRNDPAAAASRALDEAALSLAASHRRQVDRPPPENVRGPIDHLLLHLSGPPAVDDGFLVAASEAIDISEVAGAPEPVCEAAAAAADGEVLIADLTSPATQPFAVVRALVPGLLPISFGWDLEPLGMRRAAEPKVTPDGRRLGAALDLATAGPLLPHPLP